MISKTELKRLNSKEYWEGAIRESNRCGKFEIVEYVSYSEVHIKFLDTGYETYYNLGSIKAGSVKDKLKRTVYGLGYLGVGKDKSSNNGNKTDCYRCWKGMFDRCYNEAQLKRRPTYRGCTVAIEWHNFQNFAKWFEDNYIKGYQLDKDIKVEGNKVYGPETCMFVSHIENNEKANARHYKMLNPEGNVVEFFNLNQFCKDNALCGSNLYSVVRGERNHHKGWTRYEEENDNAKT